LHELQKKGLFTKEYFEKELPVCRNDSTLVKIIFEGDENKQEIVIIDKATSNPQFTSMMRMTAFSASIIAQMQARKQINVYGVYPEEKCVPSDAFVNELKKRNVIIKGLLMICTLHLCCCIYL
jgi:saccharopine dehydrogenase-like NADP-dependent oxidoreductase